MTDRQLYDAAHSLALMQEYAQENGVQFVFTVAPNKNSLYGEHMPYYDRYFRSPGSNLSRLIPFLEEEGVNYADLYGLLDSREEVLYHKRDSHWNNRGAALAADELLSALGKEHPSYENRQYETRKDYEGDLDGMLYPAAVTKENEIYYDPSPQFAYVEEVENNFDPKIQTVNEDAAGSLVMYRDSFGNALLPFMAEAYGNAYFSRSVPYQMTDLFAYGADTLVIERAERFLPDLAAAPPMMAAPIADVPDDAEFSRDFLSDLEVTGQGSFTLITGRISSADLEPGARIYVRVNGLVDYEAFPVALADGSEGFQLLVATETLQGEGDTFLLYIEPARRVSS